VVDVVVVVVIGIVIVFSVVVVSGQAEKQFNIC